MFLWFQESGERGPSHYIYSCWRRSTIHDTQARSDGLTENMECSSLRDHKKLQNCGVLRRIKITWHMSICQELLGTSLTIWAASRLNLPQQSVHLFTRMTPRDISNFMQFIIMRAVQVESSQVLNDFLLRVWVFYLNCSHIEILFIIILRLNND